MVDFIAGNVYSVALIIAVIGVLIYLTKTGKKVLVKGILKELIVRAESYYKSGQGKSKKKFVVREFYNRAKILSVFLSREELDHLIESLVEEVKEKL